MAEKQQRQQQERMQAPFPQPPPFYKHFTPANLSHLRKLRKEAGLPAKHTTSSLAGSGTTSHPPHHGLDILSLPPELRYLIPPPPPPTNTPFSAFGATHNLSSPPPNPTTSLQELNIPSLLPSSPTEARAILLQPQAHLISLARTHLTTFLLLIGNLSQNPAEGWEAATRDLETAVGNLHALVNGYRPHQARETLIQAMEERVRGLREEIGAIERGREEVGKVLRELSLEAGHEGEGGEAMEGVTHNGVDGRREDDEMQNWKARQKAAWDTIEAIMGAAGS